MNYTLSALIFSLGFLIGITVYAQSEDQPYFEGSLKFSVEYSGDLAEMLEQNEPNDELLMHIKGGNYIIQLSGGRYPKTFLFIADSNYEYSVNMSEKLAFRYSKYTDRTIEAQDEPDPIAKPTGKQKEVNGILCDEYRLATPKTIFYYYTNDAYRVNVDAYPEEPRSKVTWLAKGLEGRIPLETIKKQKNLMVKTTLLSLNTREFSLSQFMIPPGFKIKGRDYRF